MERTAHYQLNKPEQTDFYNVEDFNQNSDTIDRKLKINEQAAQNAQSSADTAQNAAQAANDNANGRAQAVHTHAAEDIASGVLTVNRGGTNTTSFAANRIVVPTSTTALAQQAFPSAAGSFLRQNTSGAPFWSTPAEVLGAVGAVNPNILHNADFRGASTTNWGSVVNQVGASSYSAITQVITHAIDRWILREGNGTLSRQAGYIRLARTSTASTSAIFQTLEFPQSFGGKTLTLSVKNAPVASTGSWGLFVSTSAAYYGTQMASTANMTNSANSVSSITVELPSSPSALHVGVSNAPSAGTGNLNISGIKLELGSVSTMANQPPQNYGEELAKCQRFQVVLPANSRWATAARRWDANSVDANIPLPVSLRANPVVDGEFSARHGTGGIILGYPQLTDATSRHNLFLRFSYPNSWASGYAAELYTASAILIDANI
ncbi:MAG: hypothetical protein FWH04_07355 [Oscillospiraceae bacterium]|nr:hypothetical protein [Oscillospiraceae bacterium]